MSSGVDTAFLESAATYWRDVVNMQQKKAEMEQQALAMVANEERSSTSKGLLLELTQDLKKSSPEDRLKKMPSAFKAYHEELSQLTKRAKYAEGCFMALFQSLSAAPDPAPLLAQATELASRRRQAEAEAAELRQRLADDEKEFLLLKNQDITVRRLEHQIKEYEKKMEARVSEALAERERAARAELEAAHQALQAQDRLFHQQLQAAKEALAESLVAQEQTQSQLFEARAKSEDASAAHDAEAQLLSAELERLNALLASAHRQLEEHSSRPRASQTNQAQLEQQIADLTEELAQSRQLVERSEVEARGEAERAARAQRQLELVRQQAHQQQAAQAEMVHSLQQELANRPSRHDYEQLKTQVQILEVSVIRVWLVMMMHPMRGSLDLVGVRMLPNAM